MERRLFRILIVLAAVMGADGIMLAAAFVYVAEGRELTQREALGLGADCIVPILGSFLWNAAYRAHPEWPGQ